MTVYGLPLKLHLAKSKAEAVDLLSTTLAFQGSSEAIAAVALVDVVMESASSSARRARPIRPAPPSLGWASARPECI